MSKQDDQWECVPLTVEDILKEGEDLVYYVSRTLYYLARYDE